MRVGASFYYLSSNRDMSLHDLLMFHSHEEEVAQLLRLLILAVSHLHGLGHVHRNLRPELVFQSNDARRPLFIVGHDYTTEVSNQNQNFGLPDNIYMIRNTSWRAGSKKPDLCALGGILMAWHVGLVKYQKEMKKKSNR